ncbi:PREDICTED: uncharacterized protein LOC109585382 [Amphimedon queenslandica]|uniref:Uncharacterized protein n=1 Tax=Amphimedon queenslandica TaxID=400682 RepID=A0A1X7VNV9_AMPQE|nr:PREDICTED: uncharacterized protein LOC109585382 [Amphimedon queenslandica]|eukprot:XP_019857011.1 PREDICTED: uncharacterized protein LOC109585382 [Amphimedon queenslandica]
MFAMLGFARSSYAWRLILHRENAIAVYPGGHFPRESPAPFSYAVEGVQATSTISERIRVLEPRMYPVVTGLFLSQKSGETDIHNDSGLFPSESMQLSLGYSFGVQVESAHPAEAAVHGRFCVFEDGITLTSVVNGQIIGLTSHSYTTCISSANKPDEANIALAYQMKPIKNTDGHAHRLSSLLTDNEVYPVQAADS